MELESTVEANTQLLEWEKSQLELETGTMAFDLRAAELDLLKLEKGEGPLELSRLEEKATEAEKKYEQFRGYENELLAYYEQGLIQPYELDEAKKEIQAARRIFEAAGRELAAYRDYVLPTAMEKARAKVSQARLSLEQKKKNGGYKIGNARAALTLARKELESNLLLLQKATEDLKKTEILAPIPGMAILREGFYNGNRRKPRIGDRVLRNQAIVYVPDISKMLVRTKIREIDLHKVSPGKKALVRVDAYPELLLNGLVDNIGAIAESDIGAATEEKYFSIDVLVEESDPRLRPGMTSQVEIMCATLDKVLTVPVYGVFTENGGKYCMVEKRGELEWVPVTVGAVNEYWAEIREGLSPGDRISLQGTSVP
jgi:HlyD family secretion protein